jgi:hypothetical protein
MLAVGVHAILPNQSVTRHRVFKSVIPWVDPNTLLPQFSAAGQDLAPRSKSPTKSLAETILAAACRSSESNSLLSPVTRWSAWLASPMASKKSSLGSEERSTEGSAPPSSASFLIWLTRQPALLGLMSSASLGLLNVARSSSACASQVRSGNFPSSQALTIAGGLARGRDQGGYEKIRIEDHARQSLLAARSARTSLTASSTKRWISSVGAGVALAHVLDRELKHGPAHGVLHELP